MPGVGQVGIDSHFPPSEPPQERGYLVNGDHLGDAPENHAHVMGHLAAEDGDHFMVLVTVANLSIIFGWKGQRLPPSTQMLPFYI